MDEFSREIRSLHRVHMLKDALESITKLAVVLFIAAVIIWLGAK